VAMLFCQLSHTDSLREICNGLSCCLEKLTHLGVNRAPQRSTLSSRSRSERPQIPAWGRTNGLFTCRTPGRRREN
jgi:hypothetical protein